MPINKSDVERLSPNSQLWDGGRGAVPGFGVRRQRAYATFVVKYRHAGKQRWYTIGRFGAPWTVEQARAEAKKVLGRVAAGEDPAAAVKDVAVQALPETVAQLCDRYMEAAYAGAILTRFNRPKRQSTLQIDAGRISRHIVPLIGSVAVSDIDSRTVRRLIDDITTGKTVADIKTKKRGRAIVTGGAASASRVADLLSGIMAWAVEQGSIDRNPVHGVRRFRGEPRQRFLSSDELKRLGVTLQSGVDGSGAAFHPYALLIVKMLALTGCRVSEIARLQWVEVDFESSCLRLEETKTGRSLRAIGSIPLELLRSQPRIAKSSYVFPGAGGELPYGGINKEARRIFDAAGLSDASCHTLRHTFASVASELEYSDGTIAGLIGHKGRGVTSRYVHQPDQALLSAAEAVSAMVAVRLDARAEQ